MKKKALIASFTIDLPKVEPEIYKRLLKLGSYRVQDNDRYLWSFTIDSIEAVGFAIGADIVFEDMRV